MDHKLKVSLRPQLCVYITNVNTIHTCNTIHNSFYINERKQWCSGWHCLLSPPRFGVLAIKCLCSLQALCKEGKSETNIVYANKPETLSAVESGCRRLMGGFTLPQLSHIIKALRFWCLRRVGFHPCGFSLLVQVLPSLLTLLLTHARTQDDVVRLNGDSELA